MLLGLEITGASSEIQLIAALCLGIIGGRRGDADRAAGHCAWGCIFDGWTHAAMPVLIPGFEWYVPIVEVALLGLYFPHPVSLAVLTALGGALYMWAMGTPQDLVMIGEPGCGTVIQWITRTRK